MDCFFSLPLKKSINFKVGASGPSQCPWNATTRWQPTPWACFSLGTAGDHSDTGGLGLRPKSDQQAWRAKLALCSSFLYIPQAWAKNLAQESKSHLGPTFTPMSHTHWPEHWGRIREWLKHIKSSTPLTNTTSGHRNYHLFFILSKQVERSFTQFCSFLLWECSPLILLPSGRSLVMEMVSEDCLSWWGRSSLLGEIPKGWCHFSANFLITSPSKRKECQPSASVRSWAPRTLYKSMALLFQSKTDKRNWEQPLFKATCGKRHH